MDKKQLLRQYPDLVRDIALEFREWAKNYIVVNEPYFDKFVESVHQIKKDWTILSFIATKNHGYEGYILLISDITSPIEDYLGNVDGFWEIHSVRRESDGEVFTVGDRFKCCSCSGVLEKITIGCTPYLQGIGINKMTFGYPLTEFWDDMDELPKKI